MEIEEVQFPLFLIWGKRLEYAEFATAEELECNLEFYDTDDPNEPEDVFLDARMRRIHLKLDFLQVQELSLKAADPISADVELFKRSTKIDEF